MRQLLSPLCLFFALVSFICAFALFAKGVPEPNLELHISRMNENQEHQQTLENKLKRSRWVHSALIGGLFTSGILFAGAAFMTLSTSIKDE